MVEVVLSYMGLIILQALPMVRPSRYWQNHTMYIVGAVLFHTILPANGQYGRFGSGAVKRDQD